jgi:ribosomal protein S18 acetylase RimI-like enzyme
LKIIYQPFKAKNTDYKLIDMCEKDLELLWQWHKEHVAINFPTQKPDKNLFFTDLNDPKSSGQKHIIVDISGNKVGFIWFDMKQNPYEKCLEGSIRYIHIDENHRKKGIASAALKHAECIFKAAGVSFVTLGTNINNKPSNELYKQLRFKPVRILYRKDI